MATFSVTIPDPVLNRVLNAIAYSHGYTDYIVDANNNQIPNPMTKAQYCKNILKDWIKSNVIFYESTKAADVARDSARLAAETEITIGD